MNNRGLNFRFVTFKVTVSQQSSERTSVSIHIYVCIERIFVIILNVDKCLQFVYIIKRMFKYIDISTYFSDLMMIIF